MKGYTTNRVNNAIEYRQGMTVVGTTGLLVEPGDSRAMGNAILRLKQDRKLRERLARNALHHVASQFSVSEMANRYFDLYTKTVKGRNRDSLRSC